MWLMFLILVVLFYVGTRGHRRPIGCLGAIIRALLIILFVSAMVGLGIVPWFIF